MKDEELQRVLDSTVSSEDQPQTEEQKRQVERAYDLFKQFFEEEELTHMRMRDYRRLRRLDDERLDSEGAPKLNTLNSTIDNVIADQMDNLPCAIILPETPEKEQTADLMTDVIRYCLDAGAFEKTYTQLMEDSIVTGTGVAEVFWDEEQDRGLGLVNVQAVRPEAFYPDPYYDEWSRGRAIFKTTHTTLGALAEMWPEEAQYVKPDEWAMQGDGQRMQEKGAQNAQDVTVMILDYWRREYDPKRKRWRVHKMILCGRVILEETKDAYAHGEYPFIPFCFRAPEGEPFGTGLMDDYADQWRAVCRYAKYIDINARQSSRTRFIVRKGMDVGDLTDWTKDVIEFGDTDSVREFQTQPLNPQVMNFMQYISDTMKQDSGQNQFSRGEGGLGVTAAGAIEALIEAGGKTTRMHTREYKEAFRNVVRQMIWLMSQFVSKKRVLMITGADTYEAVSMMEMQRAAPRGMEEIAWGGRGIMPPPPYSVRVQVQKRSPLEMQAWNEQVYQIANLCAQAQMPMPPTAVIAMLRGMEEKSTVMRIVQESDQTRRMLQEAMAGAQQAQAAAEQAQEEANLWRGVAQNQNEHISQTDGNGFTVAGAMERSEE